MPGNYVWITVIIFLGCVINHYFNMNVPPELEQKWTYSFQIGTMTLLADIARLLTYVTGIDGRICVRILIDNLGELYPGNVDPSVVVYDDIFNGIEVRVYEPKNGTNEGGLVYLHGGGFLAGTPKLYDEVCGEIVKQTSLVLVSVHYRRTPEYTSPHILDDVSVAFNHFAKISSKWNILPESIGIAGDSSGGNLAASYSLKSSLSTEEIKPRFQVLFYPILQGIDVNLPSFHLNSYHVSPFLKKRLVTGVITSYITGLNDHYSKYSDIFAKNQQIELQKRAFYEQYMNISLLPQEYIPDDYSPTIQNLEDEDSVKSLQDGLLNPLNFPLMASDLSLVPPAYILTCQHDTLRDEGYFYYQRLINSGIDAVYLNSMQGWHGMIRDFKSVSSADEALSDAIIFMKSHS